MYDEPDLARNEDRRSRMSDVYSADLGDVLGCFGNVLGDFHGVLGESLRCLGACWGNSCVVWTLSLGGLRFVCGGLW